MELLIFFHTICHLTWSRNSIAGRVITAWAASPGNSYPGRRRRLFSSPKCRGSLLGPTQTPTQWKLGFQGSSPGAKSLSHGVYHLPPCRAEVKNEWSYTSIPIYTFMVCTGTTLCVYFRTCTLHSTINSIFCKISYYCRVFF